VSVFSPTRRASAAFVGEGRAVTFFDGRREILVTNVLHISKKAVYL
jgi:hypothetical protein